MYHQVRVARNTMVPTAAMRLGANRSLGRGGAHTSQLAEDDMATHQTRALEAKATLALRNSVVENVVAVQPTLHAVYDAAHASPVEKYTRPPSFLEAQSGLQG